MKTVEQSWNYLGSHLMEVINLSVAYFALIVPIRQYLGQKKLEEKDKRFNNYHRLIKELVSPDSSQSVMMMDRQIAVAFELRNYPEYFEVTKRILQGLKETWSVSNSFNRLTNEINETIDFIDRH